MTKQEISLIRLGVGLLARCCSEDPKKIVDLLTGYLWDEEEAGMLKEESE